MEQNRTLIVVHCNYAQYPATPTPTYCAPTTLLQYSYTLTALGAAKLLMQQFYLDIYQIERTNSVSAPQVHVQQCKNCVPIAKAIS